MKGDEQQVLKSAGGTDSTLTAPICAGMADESMTTWVKLIWPWLYPEDPRVSSYLISCTAFNSMHCGHYIYHMHRGRHHLQHRDHGLRGAQLGRWPRHLRVAAKVDPRCTADRRVGNTEVPGMCAASFRSLRRGAEKVASRDNLQRRNLCSAEMPSLQRRVRSANVPSRIRFQETRISARLCLVVRRLK